MSTPESHYNNPEQRNGVVNPTTSLPLVIDDVKSQKGQFGWTMLAGEHIPYIFRGDDVYFSARMIEASIISKYLKCLHQDIFVKCLGIKGFYISQYEAKLFSEINFFHCNGKYGVEHFTGLDLIISSEDAHNLCEFFDFCLRKLTEVNLKEKCGFVKINSESSVPFVFANGVKYVPLFYFEGETSELKTKAIKLTGWDLSYLKFLCRIQNIQNDLFSYDSCSVIDIEDVIEHFPPNTTFRDDWPETARELLVEGDANNRLNGFWIKPPTTPPLFNGGIVQKIKTVPINFMKDNFKISPKTNNLQRILAPKFILKQTEPLRLVNGPVCVFNGVEANPPADQVRFLIPIPDPVGKDTYKYAYKFQKMMIDGKPIPCINMRPYAYNDFLMVCIIDLNEYLFKNVPFHICSSVIQALKVPLYKANACQVHVFMANNTYRYCNSILPLIQVRDVLQCLPQMKYMLASNGDHKLHQVLNVNNNHRVKN